MTEQVKIVPSVLKQQVEDGMKLVALQEHYKLPATQMKAALKGLGLKIRKFHAPKFVFVTEEDALVVEWNDAIDTSVEDTVELTVEDILDDTAIVELIPAPVEESVPVEVEDETKGW